MQMKLNEARRVVLFNRDPDTGLIDMRHYLITIKTLGISKSVKQVISTAVDLSQYADVSDFIMK